MINRDELATHNLVNLKKNKWFEEQLALFKDSIPKQLGLFEDFEGNVEEAALEFCKNGEYHQAAELLLNYGIDSYCFVNDDDTTGVPLHWAIEQNEINLVMALLARGVDINESDYESTKYALSVALSHCRKDIYNLLLLHPEIDVNICVRQQLPDADIRAFFNYETENYYPIPLSLLKDEYYPFLHLTNLDLEREYEPYNWTIFAEACQRGLFPKMDILLSLGADINPYVDTRLVENGPRLINWALGQYNDEPSDDNLRRLQWFSRLIGRMDDESICEDSLFEELIESNREIQKLFGMTTAHSLIKNNSATINDEGLSLSDLQFRCIYGDVAFERHKPLSVRDDIVRLYPGLLQKHITDLKIALIDRERLIVELYEGNHQFPSKRAIVECRNFEMFDRLLHEQAPLTNFQIQLAFLSLSWRAIEDILSYLDPIDTATILGQC